LATGQSEWLPVSGTYTWLFDGSWSPDGRTFAVVTGLRESVAGVIRGVGRDGRSDVVIQDSVPLGSPHWSPSSDALFYTRGNDAVWRVPVSRRTGRQRGKAVPVQQQLETLPGIGGTQFGLTPDGRRMTYVRGTRFSNLWMLRPGPAGMPPLK
jgi:Tol biopolymer transport system component